MRKDSRYYREQFVQKLETKKFGRYTLIGEYVNASTPTLMRCNKCGNEWKTRPSNLLVAKGTNGCPVCQYNDKSMTGEEFEKKFNARFKGEFIIKPGTKYTRQANPLYLIHTKCGTSFKTYWGTFTHNYSCPECRKCKIGKERKTSEMYSSEIMKLYGDEFSLLSNYTGALEQITVRHNDCGHIWNMRASHLLQGHGCPVCKSSRGERLVRSVMNELKIDFSEQVKFQGCRNQKELPFDFGIHNENGDIKALIEYDGSQHFEEFEHFGGKVKFEQQRKNDNIKNDYCEINNIPLLRIPYTVSTLEAVKGEVVKFISNL